MAVRKDSETSEEFKLTIHNGDLEALNKIKEQYHLKDSADVIVFAIGVLSQANGKPISIEREDGSLAKLLPSEQLKK
ncbi:MAG TPA: hypothetical protein VFZ62_01090 [Candidatus Saccharimonadales bacterium]